MYACTLHQSSVTSSSRALPKFVISVLNRMLIGQMNVQVNRIFAVSIRGSPTYM